MLKTISLFLLLSILQPLTAQDYFFADLGPFDSAITSPEEFLGYAIGTHHTRHDRIVAYFELLADQSDRAQLQQYGQTYEHRRLVMLNITDPANHQQMAEIKAKHLQLCDPSQAEVDSKGLPLIINLAYNVHGNEPSGSEAALLTAYWLTASQHPDVLDYLKNAVLMVDPTINPDGRDRHTHWANMYKGDPLVADPQDAEHNEAWPRGRTNHYWFDLNRDWLLGIHPESRGKLNWYHEWYPNVVTDFHEMGTNSTYFFEPMKVNASKDPIMPKENYTTLNETFGNYFSKYLDDIGSFYFTKEVFDGTYPGYGSSYPDLQGGLGLLFEQASSRGHLQQTRTGKLSFAFTIRNQFACSRATVQAAVENQEMLYNYQRDFFQSAIKRAESSAVSGYVFGDAQDENRTRAFIDKLLLHRVKVFELKNEVSKEGKKFQGGKSYLVPTKQPQYRMVQTMFETYDEYRDSVYYDASAWSVANFYNMPYAAYSGKMEAGKEVTQENNQTTTTAVEKSDYAYLIDWDDYFAPAVLNHLQQGGAIVKSAFKPFSIEVNGESKAYDFGTLMLPVSNQKITSSALHNLLVEAYVRTPARRTP